MIDNLYFFTATILEWKHALAFDKYKDVIIDSFKYLTDEKLVKIYAFVIMPNHYHTVWNISPEIEKEDFQRNLQKFTSQKILRDLKINNSAFYKEFYVGANDRKHQLWERNPLSVQLYSQPVIEQKINYIHFNPVRSKWNLAIEPSDYKYSSAKFYYEDYNEFGFLENYMSVSED